ncbi:transcription factor FapR [Anoxynatronum buryatiense]|uniref:Acyl-coenzyme A thioesterase PaaI, contains HGG motif n=1 Tax=Anoxynatronum buryatiense TaxID=489973 RepID=A0AA45WUA4_9CLOT|nr:transcription factor FapR [Anoxynatronum buryatiense]SMP47022.1 Acyl-coenzyme A thioesterase PaaI, contains HGG motif [Anoxynatronum buryatiense]
MKINGSTPRRNKRERQVQLQQLISEDPFLTDEDLAIRFQVSIQTIRLDRLELGIPELRERMRHAASENYEKVRSMAGTEIVGELIDLKLGESGISILETNREMAFKKTSMVMGHHIYSQAESLAMAVIDANAALTGVSNIKYLQPVESGDKLVAKAEVVRVRGNKHFVHVLIQNRQVQVFRGKFILVTMDTIKEERV